MKTLKERFIVALTKEGYYQVTGRSSKSVKLVNDENAVKMFYFVGNNGSLRVGPNKVTSWPVSEQRRVELLKAVPQ